MANYYYDPPILNRLYRMIVGILHVLYNHDDDLS
jgi:hypothetical protein